MASILIHNKHDRTPILLLGKYHIKPRQTVLVPEEVVKKFKSNDTGKACFSKYLKVVKPSEPKKETRVARPIVTDKNLVEVEENPEALTIEPVTSVSEGDFGDDEAKIPSRFTVE